MAIILHITERSAWEQACAQGRYRAASLDSEGFIHCSTARQVIDTANRYYRGRRDLVILCIDDSRTAARLEYEPPAGPAPRDPAAGLFPHLYGPVELDAVVQVVDLPPGPDGTFALPAPLAPLLS